MSATDSHDALTRLATELRGPLPDGLGRLTPAELDHLAGAVADARRQQGREIAAAADRGLSFVPRLMRATLKKALG